MPGTVLSMQNFYLVKKNYANPPEGDTKPPEDSASMKFVYHQLNEQRVCVFASKNQNNDRKVWKISWNHGMHLIQSCQRCLLQAIEGLDSWIARIAFTERAETHTHEEIDEK